jgi:hypothetical protein
MAGLPNSAQIKASYSIPTNRRATITVGRLWNQNEFVSRSFSFYQTTG